MKYYTEEEVQEIVLNAVVAGFNVTSYKVNAENCGTIEECLSKGVKEIWHSVAIDACKSEANAILKELNVQEI